MNGSGCPEQLDLIKSAMLQSPIRTRSQLADYRHHPCPFQSCPDPFRCLVTLSTHWESKALAVLGSLVPKRQGELHWGNGTCDRPSCRHPYKEILARESAAHRVCSAGRTQAGSYGQ